MNLQGFTRRQLESSPQIARAFVNFVSDENGEDYSELTATDEDTCKVAVYLYDRILEALKQPH